MTRDTLCSTPIIRLWRQSNFLVSNEINFTRFRIIPKTILNNVIQFTARFGEYSMSNFCVQHIFALCYARIITELKLKAFLPYRSVIIGGKN